MNLIQRRYRRLVPVMLALATPCARAQQMGSGESHAPSTKGFSDAVRDGLAAVRAATARFVSLDSAVAAGYPRDVTSCFEDPNHGAMGFHHMNRALLDARVDVERPEILLYERRRDGKYQLNGVEYIVPYTKWPKDSVPPMLLEQRLKRADDLGVWYLHVWAWRENPVGLFADWNPKVRCS